MILIYDDAPADNMDRGILYGNHRWVFSSGLILFYEMSKKFSKYSIRLAAFNAMGTPND
jgi:hypothetical protein